MQIVDFAQVVLYDEIVLPIFLPSIPAMLQDSMTELTEKDVFPEAHLLKVRKP